MILSIKKRMSLREIFLKFMLLTLFFIGKKLTGLVIALFE